MKMRVHNKFEASALIKSAIKNGAICELDNSQWFTYEGQFLFSLTVVNALLGEVKIVQPETLF